MNQLLSKYQSKHDKVADMIRHLNEEVNVLKGKQTDIKAEQERKRLQDELWSLGNQKKGIDRNFTQVSSHEEAATSQVNQIQNED